MSFILLKSFWINYTNLMNQKYLYLKVVFKYGRTIARYWRRFDKTVGIPQKQVHLKHWTRKMGKFYVSNASSRLIILSNPDLFIKSPTMHFLNCCKTYKKSESTFLELCKFSKNYETVAITGNDLKFFI